MSADCIFCRIIAGELPAAMVYQDELVTAFRDVQPQASTHVLVVPNRHIASLDETSDGDEPLLGRLLSVSAKVARMEGIQTGGYRVTTNVGADSGQTVFHLHVHVLGGNRLNMRLA